MGRILQEENSAMQTIKKYFIVVICFTSKVGTLRKQFEMKNLHLGGNPQDSYNDKAREVHLELHEGRTEYNVIAPNKNKQSNIARNMESLTCVALSP